MILRDVLRTRPNGTPIPAGTNVEILRESDSALLTTVQTDGTGMFSWEPNYNPGPVHYRYTHNGETRIHSTRAIMPVGAVDLSGLTYALQVFSPGVIRSFPGKMGTNGLRVLANGSNMTVTVDGGASLAYGIMHWQRTFVNFVVPTAPTSGSRTDSICVRHWYEEANRGRTELLYLTNSTAIEADASQLVGYVDVWLATIQVDANVTAIATSKVTDRRVTAAPQGVAYPQVHAINLEDTIPERLITVSTYSNVINTTSVLPAGQWSGLIHGELGVVPLAYPTLDAIFGSASATSPAFANGETGWMHVVIPVTNVSGSLTARLRVLIPTANGGDPKAVWGGRIYGTLTRTG